MFAGNARSTFLAVPSWGGPAKELIMPKPAAIIGQVILYGAFAAFIGLDAVADADLMWIAEDAMLHPLPPGASAARATCNT